MAVTKLTQIKTTLGKAVDYVCQAYKTNGHLLVSSNAGLSWVPEDITKGFMATHAEASFHKSVGRPGSVLAHHLIQSFKPGEVDANEAHDIGMELIHELLGDAHDYVVATHVDKDHIHNHILFNPVNRDTWKRWRCPKTRVYDIRELSDKLCRQHGLSVIKNRRGHGRDNNIGDLYAQARGDSRKDDLRRLIDAAISETATWEGFQTELVARGIKMETKGQHILFTLPGTKRSIRGAKLGAPYAPAALRARLGRAQVFEYVAQKHLIEMREDGTIEVLLPGTRGSLALILPASSISDSGGTYRLYIEAGAELTIINTKDASFHTQIEPRQLYTFFTLPVNAPPALIAGKIPRGKTPAQRAYFAAIDNQCEKLRARADVVNLTARAVHMGTSELTAYRDELRLERDNLVEKNASLVIERQATLDEGKSSEVIDRKIDRTTTRITTLETALKRIDQRTQTQTRIQGKELS
ncbi:relaxase/mobilization nuclease domain-containing protein [Actinotignum sp. GS-2025b]|uniref:relaxase/mobilization nuclease domain-containing protein n=1 Tax=Actinotignum sp. GS-2025b TaxID=3427275 RepID=UPI003F44CD2E